MYALECGLYDHIISWCPNGLAFVIMKPESFANRVLPELFNREAKFASFDRKVRRTWYSSLLLLLHALVIATK